MIRVGTVRGDGFLKQYAEGFVARLLSLRYTHRSARDLLDVFGHLDRWLVERRIRPSALTKERIIAFLRSRRLAGYRNFKAHRGGRGLEAIVRYLRGIGVVPLERAAKRTALNRLLVRYAGYLARERALAPSTIERRVGVASRFLAKGVGPRALHILGVADVRAFMRRMSRNLAPASLAVTGSDVRSLLRFLFVEGLIQFSLEKAVPRSARRRDGALPQGISSRDLRRMLRSCDRRTLLGKRDFAILMLLSRLGLRSGEVCGLALDDFHWRRGVITVHGKGRKLAQLPLPDDVGRAVAAYVLRRPRIETRRIFLRVRAPLQPLGRIKSCVLAVSQRAGLRPVSPHRLRRTAATEMLRGGASLTEIAQVLRHTSTAMTAIYAKVDRRALRELAQPLEGVRT